MPQRTREDVFIEKLSDLLRENRASGQTAGSPEESTESMPTDERQSFRSLGAAVQHGRTQDGNQRLDAVDNGGSITYGEN